MQEFKAGKSPIMLATDVAARGLGACCSTILSALQQLASMPRAALALAHERDCPQSARLCALRTRVLCGWPLPLCGDALSRPAVTRRLLGLALARHRGPAPARCGRQSQPPLWWAAAQLTARRTAVPRQLSPGPPHGRPGMRACRAFAGVCSQAAGSSPRC